MTEEPMGQFAAAIVSGEVELNPHLTPEQQKAFAAHVEFFDRVVAKGMAAVEAEKRELMAAGLMTEDGNLTEKARQQMPSEIPGEGYWLMEMERESLPTVRAESNQLSPEIQPQIDRMIAGLNAFRTED